MNERRLNAALAARLASRCLTAVSLAGLTAARSGVLTIRQSRLEALRQLLKPVQDEHGARLLPGGTPGFFSNTNWSRGIDRVVAF